ncbi:DsbA family protein [Enterococcus florum]|uniref:DsbA family protein n=1 Tax=Enterococcus florum TaxID=2480627 RepID=A0A4P5PDC7_9ENTE|nr:DsbA family protein [Enterococcus florum]GCF94028.1 DsbA family protein [Enterococcus florum]
MIEIYLFINPIGEKCYGLERKILELIDKHDLKIQLRLIPLMNLHTITDFMERKGLSKQDIAARNALSKNIYSACLDVKAAQLQGKKKGRDFLLRLQEEVAINQLPYSPELSRSLFKEVGGDMETFCEDRSSEFILDAFVSDQQIAREMDITQHPSAVIYNCVSDDDSGVRIEGCDSIQHVIDSFGTKESTLEFFKKLKAIEQPKKNSDPKHLSLLI